MRNHPSHTVSTHQPARFSPKQKDLREVGIAADSVSASLPPGTRLLKTEEAALILDEAKKMVAQATSVPDLLKIFCYPLIAGAMLLNEPAANDSERIPMNEPKKKTNKISKVEKSTSKWGGDLGSFGLFLQKHDIARDKLAEIFDVTPAYISMLGHKKATPGLALALNILRWTRKEGLPPFGPEDWGI